MKPKRGTVQEISRTPPAIQQSQTELQGNMQTPGMPVHSRVSLKGDLRESPGSIKANKQIFQDVSFNA